VLDAGVVDQDVDAAEVALGIGEQLGDLCRWSDTSAPWWPTLWPCRPTSASAAEASPKPLRIRLAPASASFSAMPRPIPLVEPVTSAVLPVRFMVSPAWWRPHGAAPCFFLLSEGNR